MWSPRMHQRRLLLALLGCQTLLWAFSAFVGAHHLADLLRSPAPGGLALVVADAGVLVAVAAAVALTVVLGRDVVAVRERRALLARDLAAGLGDLLVRVGRGEPVDHTGGAGRLAADEDDTLRVFAQAYAAAAGAALAQAA